MVKSLRMHHDVVDPVLAVLGTLFAILIGFMLANSMQRFESARTNVEHEAGSIADVYRLSAGMPADLRDKTRKHCLLYTQSVIKDEWPAMQQGNLATIAGTQSTGYGPDVLSFQPVNQAEI